MQLSRKEREMLSADIQQENEMIRKLGGWIRNSFIMFIAFAGLAYYGWSGIQDPLFPNASGTVHTVCKWIGLVGAVLFGIFTILTFLSHRNGKKSLMRKIDMFEDSKARKTSTRKPQK